jgi:hypothetical protein
LDAKIYFDNAVDFSGGDRFRARSAARFQVVAIANSFKYYTSHNSGCGSTAPASAIPHRNSEDFARTSEGSASCA